MLFGLFKKKSEGHKNSHKKNKESEDVTGSGLSKKTLNLTVSVSTHPGCIREANEDDYYITDVGDKTNSIFSFDTVVDNCKFGIYSVFDGMGGEAYGEKASKTASEALKDFVSELNCNEITSENITKMIEQFLNMANKRICDMIEQLKCSRSGCTMAMIVVFDRNVYAFSVGDSRIYRQKGTIIEQISEDQTLAVKKLKANIYTEEEAKNSSDAHRITSYIGMDNKGVGIPYHAYESFELDDCTVLLCSDGLTDMCSDEEISEIISTKDTDTAKSLVEKAIANGGEDNVTCIVIKETPQKE